MTERPAGISDRDWAIYQRHERYEAEQAQLRQEMAARKSNQFNYVPGESEATVEAVIGK